MKATHDRDFPDSQVIFFPMGLARKSAPQELIKGGFELDAIFMMIDSVHKSMSDSSCFK